MHRVDDVVVTPTYPGRAVPSVVQESEREVTSMVKKSAIRVLASVVVGGVILGGCGTPADKSGGQPTADPVVLHGINTRENVDIQLFGCA